MSAVGLRELDTIQRNGSMKIMPKKIKVACAPNCCSSNSVRALIEPERIVVGWGKSPVVAVTR